MHRPNLASALATLPSQQLTQALEAFEHLMFEPMQQTDLDQLYALYEQWQSTLGDTPDAIAICDALDDFIAVGIEHAGLEAAIVEQVYFELVELIQSQGQRH